MQQLGHKPGFGLTRKLPADRSAIPMTLAWVPLTECGITFPILEINAEFSLYGIGYVSGEEFPVVFQGSKYAVICFE